MEHEVRETPLRIDSSGTHKLSSDLTVKGYAAILIEADDVDLDLNGYTVRCLPVHPKPSDGSMPPPPIGIHASGQKNIMVRNGKVTACGRGFQASYENCGVRLEGVDFSGNVRIGANLRGASDCIVRGCTFAKIGGDLYEAYATGLNAVGPDSVVEHNLFVDLYRQSEVEGPGEGVGIIAGDGKMMIRYNWFANAVSRHGTIGVWGNQNSDVSVVENCFTNIERGVASRGTLTVTNNRFLLRDPLPDTRDQIAVGANGGGVASWNVVVGYTKSFKIATASGLIDNSTAPNNLVLD